METVVVNNLVRVIVMKKIEDGEMIESRPTFFLSDDDAQLFFDYLWENGMKPSKQDSAGALSAQSKHLEDMRKIAFMFIEAKHD